MEVFPSWRYHKELGEKLVLSDEEDASLGLGWVDTPAKFEADDVPVKKDDQVEELPVEADDVPVKKRGRKPKLEA